jgi:hypothetical protein
MSGKIFRLEKQDFHKLGKLNQDNRYQVSINNDFNDQSQSYFFTKEQILLLSPSAYKFIIANNEPFNILSFQNEEVNDHDSDDYSLSSAKKDSKAFVKAFNDILSLFNKNESIQINEESKKYFVSIAEQLQNEGLLQACQSFGIFLQLIT